ncbi:MAG: cytochrome b N-terminal domain-containing protein [Planctomycetia bacterium]|nr:cytochrome b N-terminal domain-containing protein [Planctomycetia bacterium]
MIRRFSDWLDARTDYRRFLAHLRGRTLPTGPSWWFTSASCLFWLLVVQVFTGLLLMTTYSPSTTSAWASVHYIEQSPAGAFVRGVHYFAAHAFIILFAVHLVRVLVTGAFRAPRELIWLTGLLLMPLLLAWAVTGNPLCASQKGMAQIEVEGNIAGSTPVVGPALRHLLVGGDEVGHLTLTRLYFLHVALIPLLALGLLALHLSQVYRHGLTPAGGNAGRSTPYWPYQTARNAAVVAAVLGGIALLAWRYGAPLDAPADPDLAQTPRPEWYFRCLFELRRYFTGDWEFVATSLLPAAVLTFFVSLPWLDRRLAPRAGLALRALIVAGAGAGFAWLTWSSFHRDWNDDQYQLAQAEAADLADRARALADEQQVPPQGAAWLLRQDPKTRGPWLFARHCAGCHSHADAQGQGILAAEPSAPNLSGFGTAEWIEGLLDPESIAGPRYFGHTKFAEGDMASHVRQLFADAADAEALRGKLRLAAQALAAEAERPGLGAAGAQDETAIAEGRALITGELGCTDCHKFHDNGELGSAPDLTGYGSYAWLTEMIGNPQGERFYPGDHNDRMPAFAKDPHQPQRNLLSPQEIDLVVRWLRGEWYEPFPPFPAPTDARGASVPRQVAGR